MATGAFLAVDWGTTNRRAYRIEDGAVADACRDDRGVRAVGVDGDWAGEVAALRDRLGDLPMLLAGMVGSTIGWREVPYAPAPADLPALARGCAAVDARTAIVPGVSSVEDDHADVMRGEEVQLLGAVAAGLVPADALLCQPGTHCKWARMEGGAIAGFATAMTGELFALLRAHSVLSAQLSGTVAPDEAFAEGVRTAGRRDLLSALFDVRAAAVLGRRAADAATSHASGLVIGADVHARDLSRPVHVLADAGLGALYARAIAEAGGCSVAVDAEAAFVAGITAIRELRS